MKDKVERLAKGIFEYEQPEMLLSEESLEINVATGETFCGHFSVYNRKLSLMKGILYSSSELLVLKEQQFIGKENEIAYEVNAAFANAGETHKGEITIVSDCGEIRLPFVIHVQRTSCLSSEGEIRDLFQFTGLAQSNWNEAKQLFYSDAFFKTVLADRVGEQTIYRQLVYSKTPDRALEEFLVHSKKKSSVQIKTDRNSIAFRPGRGALVERITVWKDTWGYTDIRVETEGDFFLVSANRILAENFNDGKFTLEVVVNGESLAEGNYFGRIFLKTARQCIAIEITCVVEKTAREKERKRRLFGQTEAKLYERYFDFRTGRQKPADFIAEAESIVELLLVRIREHIFPEHIEYKREMLYRSFRAYLSLIGGKTKTAEAQLEELRAEKSRGHLDAELMGALHYLDAMCQKNAEGVRMYADQIRLLSERFPESSLLLWFRIYTDRRTENGRLQHLMAMKTQFMCGQRSPLIYYETLVLWNEDPSLIKELGSFEQQVLWFALKRHLLKKETMLQCALLAPQAPTPSRLLIRCFCEAYEQFGQRDVLQVLCSLLIANGVRSEKYHRYFAESCAAQLRVNHLQDYYIYTFGSDMTKRLDQSVLLYFLYGNELEEPYRAFFYAYVVRNKDSMSSFYRTYQKKIEQYAVDCMKKGRIDRNLAIVYAEVLRDSLIDEELAETLPGLLFTYCMECENPEMVAVSVRHKEEEIDTVLDFDNGIAFLQLFTEDAAIVLLDREGNRYLPAGSARMYRLLHADELLTRCFTLAGDNKELLLNLLEKVHNYRTVGTDSIELSKRVINVAGLNEKFRQAEIHALVKYSYDNYQAELLDGYLAKLDLDYLSKEERCQAIELLIVRGRYDLAMDAVNKYGMEGVSPKRLLKLCEKLLLECQSEQNDMLLRLSIEAFRNDQYNENIIHYLVQFYNGTTEEMYRIWEASNEYAIDTEELEERLLGQLLFAEGYLPQSHKLFFSYCSKKSNLKLIRAYLSYFAYRYFVKESELLPELHEYLLREAEENNQICRLAMLKYYSGCESLDEAQMQFVNKSLAMFAEQNKLFPFFTKFTGRATIPPCMEDKQYVEYRTNPDRRVKISYLYDEGENADFIKEDMNHVGYGIFVKEFILFYEEILQYYITEENDDGQEITESFFCQIDSDKVNDETTKYGQINLILTALDLQDDKTTIDMLENYYRMEYTVNKLFSPIKE